MAWRIQSGAELKAVLDELEIAMAAEVLNVATWVVCQTWSKDAPDIAPELHGPFASPATALATCERIHAEGRVADDWKAIHGDPITTIVPVWPVDE